MIFDPKNARFRLLLATLATSVSLTAIAGPILAENLRQDDARKKAEKEIGQKTPVSGDSDAKSEDSEDDGDSDKPRIGSSVVDAWDRANGAKFKLEFRFDPAAPPAPDQRVQPSRICLAFPQPSLPKVGWLGIVSGPSMLPLPPPN